MKMVMLTVLNPLDGILCNCYKDTSKNFVMTWVNVQVRTEWKNRKLNLKQHDLNYAELDIHVEGYKLGTAFILKKIVCTFVHFLQ